MIARIILAAMLGYGTASCIGNPPLRYQHNATVTVHFVGKIEMAIACEDAAALACSQGDEIWARNPCMAKEADDLTSFASDLCHELGHVNGWPGNHPR